ncbi:MAG: HEAT repeat domain-containing protein [Planctomycetaceae bacterium]|nr:HEAT repeat domain-containing protein [Planctomycetaceae bacterium]
MRFAPLLASLMVLAPVCVRAEAPPKLVLHDGDTIVLIGNTLAERMQYFGHWETLLHARFPEKKLVVRNLGWSADELTLRPRSLNFKDHGHRLEDHKPDVILALFGFNESFSGEKGLEKFKQDLANFISETTTTKYNGEAPPTLVLVSPIANEDLAERKILAGQWNNANIALYTAAMRDIAAQHNVQFVDLYEPTLQRRDPAQLTMNGVHLNEAGDRVVGALLDAGLFGSQTPAMGNQDRLAAIKREVNEKNLQFFYDHRAVNGYYIYGDRKAPFGVINFPAEFAKLRQMIAVRDERIWKVAAGQPVPETIDDNATGEFTPIETNYQNEIHITPPEEARQLFNLPEGFEVSVYASEADFPNLRKPVAFTFDSRGRLWLGTNPSYPMYLPGTPVDDKVLIYEDVDGDGKADHETVFARGLHLPISIELGDGGAYVSAQPNMLFLKDHDGDDVADEKQLRLHGFDSADSHHALHTFEWGPGGDLYFGEGIFHHTQVETPYGPRRVKDAAIFRYEPRTEKLDIFTSYGFANPWGITWDYWGQTFVADASGGANYFGTAFSGDLDYPRKHAGMKQFLVKQWRPTCGCELVSSRHFPENFQGDYLLNNCIGFQGTLQYKVKEEGSGFAADPVDPLLRSSDPNFRPVDIQFGPDGALYILDWFNPLIGHMQHNLRDPNRDKSHGRIWRITYKGRPLVEAPQIAGTAIPQLLELLKSYEYRTRYRVRRELRDRDTTEVIAAVDAWVAGLKADDPQTVHNQLEALWVKQTHDIVDEPLLTSLLNSSEPHARAAAVRVLCYWRDRVADPLAMLQARVNDEHPRVRLEAVRALSFYDNQQALDIAVESLIYEQDEYLEYTLNETMTTLQERIGTPAP